METIRKSKYLEHCLRQNNLLVEALKDMVAERKMRGRRRRWKMVDDIKKQEINY